MLPKVQFQWGMRIVPMGPELENVYKAFEREATESVVRMLDAGDHSGLSAWFTKLLRIPDMPWVGGVCQTGKGVVLGTVEALSEASIYPLEHALLDYIQEQHQQGLRVVLYTENTGINSDQERLQRAIEGHVRGKGGEIPSVAVLRASDVRLEERVAWLNERVEAGLNVLICNPALLTATSMCAFPRVAYKRSPVSKSHLYQSAYRAYRPTQTHDVEAVIFTYQSSLALRWLCALARGHEGPTSASIATLARDVLAGEFFVYSEEDLLKLLTYPVSH